MLVDRRDEYLNLNMGDTYHAMANGKFPTRSGGCHYVHAGKKVTLCPTTNVLVCRGLNLTLQIYPWSYRKRESLHMRWPRRG